MWRRNTTDRLSRKSQLSVQETLEARHLLAGDLVAHWNADSAVTDETGAITAWIDSIGSVDAVPDGSPVLLQDGIGGRAAIRFDSSDGIDLFRVRAAVNPLARVDDFSAAIVFETDSQSLVGNNGAWFESTGLVDSNSTGLSTDWGLTINSSGQVAAGLGDGFGNPTKTVYSTSLG